MRLILIPSEKAREVWPMIIRWLEPAIDRSGGLSSADALLDNIVAGNNQLWVLWDEKEDTTCAAGVTQILTYPTGIKVADIVSFGGRERKKWLHLFSEVEAWAMQQGCDRIRIITRKGWARDLKDYKMTSVVLEKVFPQEVDREFG